MNALAPWAEVPAALLLIIAGILALTGSLGLLKFKNFYSRIHAPTLGNTLGATAVLLASLLLSSARAGHPVLAELLIVPLLFLTSPVTAMLLMQAARKRDAHRSGPAQPPQA